MVNYYNNDEKKNDYIVNYKIKNNKIIIRYANKKKKKLEYSKELEKEILDKMELQIDHFKKYIKDFKYAKIQNLILSIFTLILSILIIPIANTLIIPIIGVCFSQIFFTLSIRLNKELNEYKKNIFIISNKSTINNNKDIYGIQMQLDDVTRIKLQQVEKINVNNVSKFSLNELYTLKETIIKMKKVQTFEEPKRLSKKKYPAV